MPNGSPSSESSFLVKVDGIADYWTTKTGGNTTRETAKAFNGGEEYPVTVAGRIQVDDIVVTRPYYAARDAEMVRTLRRNKTQRWTLSVQPTDENGARVGQPEVYPDAIVLDVTSPDVNAGSSAVGMVSVKFGVSRVV